MKISKIEVISNEEDIVYDLEVEGNHNYFVEDVLVHNCHGASSGSTKSKKDREKSGTIMRQVCDNCMNASWRFGFTGRRKLKKSHAA